MPATPDPGSFRDPDSRVFEADGRVLRTLSARGRDDFDVLAETPFYQRRMAAGDIVATERVESPPAALLELDEVPGAVLEHERVPYVSYPYEWPFEMLRDAALLQLDLMLDALDAGMILKDASPYNVQWRGSRPVFIDLGSFEPLREGEPWAGYRQFCELYLYPLMIEAYKGVSMRPFLRGRVDGITPTECRNLLSFRDRFRRGTLANVYLHSRLERRYAESSHDVKGEIKRAGFRPELLRASVERLRKLVRRLEPRDAKTEWSGYESTGPYAAADSETKAAFVGRVTGERSWRLLWDLGCNEGAYTRIAARSCDHAVAFDADAGVVSTLYRNLREQGDDTILPLVMDLTDPSPALGWRGAERRTPVARGRPDLVLALALAHHVSITGNVPLAQFVDWLAELGAALVTEFVGRGDPMAQRLLARKREGLHRDYDLDNFERLLADAFDIEAQERLEGGDRTLYFARPRAGRTQPA